METTLDRHAAPTQQQPGSTTEQQPQSGSTKKPRNGKLARIKRSDNSFRPGRPATVPLSQSSGQPKKLVFTMPATLPLATREEAAEVHSMAVRLSEHTDLGVVSSVTLGNGTWEIAVTLKPGNTNDEDEFLSNIFRQLAPTIESVPKLMTGFRQGAVARWDFYIGKQLLDGDTFA